MLQSSKIFMLSSVINRHNSVAEIIKQTFSKHFQIQQRQPNYIFRIYVYSENYHELTNINSLLWANRNLQFYPHYLMNNIKERDNQIFYDSLIFYTPIVLSSNYQDLTQIDDFINKNYKNKNPINIENIVIFISDDRQELLPNSTNLADYFDFGRFSTLVDIVYTSQIAVKNGRIRYRKYQQKNLKIQHLEWNK